MKNITVSEMNLGTILGIVFVVLKLVGVINWSWFWVLSPFWICIVLILLIAITILILNRLRF